MHVMSRICMLAMMFLLTRAVFASDSLQQAAVADNHEQGINRLPPAYPVWREYETNRNIVPPPSGPYMSTALTPMPGVYQSEVGSEQNAGTEMANSPFFSPDTKWPDETRLPSHRWMPEEGQYQYVSEEALEKQKQLDTGYSGQQPPMLPWRTYARPVYHSRPVIDSRAGYKRNSAYGRY